MDRYGGEFDPNSHSPDLPSDLLVEPLELSPIVPEALPRSEQAAVDTVLDLLKQGVLDAASREAIEAGLEAAELRELRNDPAQRSNYLNRVSESKFVLNDLEGLHETTSNLLEIGSVPDLKNVGFLWRRAVESAMRSAADLGLPEVIEEYQAEVIIHGDEEMKKAYNFHLESAYKSTLIGLLWDKAGKLRDEETLTEEFNNLVSVQERYAAKRDIWLDFLLTSSKNAQMRMQEDKRDRRRIAQTN